MIVCSWLSCVGSVWQWLFAVGCQVSFVSVSGCLLLVVKCQYRMQTVDCRVSLSGVGCWMSVSAVTHYFSCLCPALDRGRAEFAKNNLRASFLIEEPVK